MIAKVLLVDPPNWFGLVWTMIRTAVQPTLLSRVKMLSHKDLPAYIYRESIPMSMGGAYEYDANEWLKSAGFMENRDGTVEGSPSDEESTEEGRPEEQQFEGAENLEMARSGASRKSSSATSEPGSKQRGLVPRLTTPLSGSHPTRVITKRPPMDFNVLVAPRTRRDRADSGSGIAARANSDGQEAPSTPNPTTSARTRYSGYQRSNSSNVMYSSRESTHEE